VVGGAVSRVVLVVEVETVGDDPLVAPLTDAASRALAHEAAHELAGALQKAMAGSTVLRRTGVWLLAGEQAYRVLEVVPPRY
jgi:hypothetical protein